MNFLYTSILTPYFCVVSFKPVILLSSNLLHCANYEYASHNHQNWQEQYSSSKEDNPQQPRSQVEQETEDTADQFPEYFECECWKLEHKYQYKNENKECHFVSFPAALGNLFL